MSQSVAIPMITHRPGHRSVPAWGDPQSPYHGDRGLLRPVTRKRNRRSAPVRTYAVLDLIFDRFHRCSLFSNMSKFLSMLNTKKEELKYTARRGDYPLKCAPRLSLPNSHHLGATRRWRTTYKPRWRELTGHKCHDPERQAIKSRNSYV